MATDEEIGRMCSDLEILVALEKLPASTRSFDPSGYNSAVRKVQKYLPKNPEDFLAFIIDFYKYSEDKKAEEISSVNNSYLEWRHEIMSNSEDALRRTEDLAVSLRSLIKEAKNIPK